MARVPSSQDMLGMVAELNVRRIAMVMNQRYKRLGGMLVLTEKQSNLLLTARKLHHRYLQDHYQHDESEQCAIRDLAYWLIEEHKLNVGIKEPTSFEYDMRKQVAKEPPARGTYRVLLERVFRD